MLDYKIEPSTRKITNLMIGLIVVFAFFAICGYGRITNILAAVCMLLFVLFQKSICLSGDFKTCIGAFIAFFLIHFVISIINMQSVYYFLGTNVVWILIEFAPLFICVCIFNNNDDLKLKKLFFCLTFVWLAIVFISIVAFSSAEMGGRSYAQSARGNFIGGGYPTAYGSAILAVALIQCLLTLKFSTKVRLLLLAFAAVSIIHVFFTQSVITLVALLVGISIAILFRNGLSKNPIVIISIIVLFLIVSITIIINIKNIGFWLIETGSRVKNPIFAQRIQEVGLMFSSDTETYHMGQRMNTLTYSLNAFISSPVYGVAYKVGNTFELLSSVGVGTHSDILDSLAKYGVIGAIPLYIVYYSFLHFLKCNMVSKNILPISSTLIVLALFNPFISAQTGFVFFLYLPLLFKIVKTYGKPKKSIIQLS